MADFVAVLKKTIDGMGDTTPELRARVYDKARSTVSAKLAAIQPPPPAAVVEKQKASLEQAIRDVEADYAVATVAEDDDFDTIINELSKDHAPSVAAAAPAKPAAEASPVVPAPVVTAPAPAPAPPPTVSAKPVVASNDTVEAPPAKTVDTPKLAGEAVVASKAAKAKGRSGGLVAVALIAVVFLGAAGYAIWLNRDEVAQMIGLADPAPQPTTPATPPPSEPVTQPAATPAADEPVTKFTQKLNADGSETDAGPAGGEPGVGEGTSVAELTTPPENPPAATTPAPGSEPAAPATPEGEADPATTPATTPATPVPAQTPAAETVAVGQRAIFYEERTSSTDGSAQQGNTVWSLVQESPGGDLPPEPAIRAEATIPGKDIQLRMTIRRNGDTTLPASHIIEMIFLTPENFEGGVIDNLLRMTFKETEEATGMPVIGSPAKIGDGFFLIALGNSPQEIETNLQLFRRMKWIDIPIVYRSGRRALMTLERGVPGDRVFDEALKAWAASSG